MRNPVISLAVLAAFFVAAPAATAGERYPLRKDLPPLPESLPDEAFGWSGGVEPTSAGFMGGWRLPYRDTYEYYVAHLGCDQRPHDRWFVGFEFSRRRSLRAILRARRDARPHTGDSFRGPAGAPLCDSTRAGRAVVARPRRRSGRPGAAKATSCATTSSSTKDRSGFTGATYSRRKTRSQIRGAAARDLIRKIHRADSIAWTDVETATTSPAMPINDEMRASIGRMMESCGISHEPPPATPTAAPDPACTSPLTARDTRASITGTASANAARTPGAVARLDVDAEVEGVPACARTRHRRTQLVVRDDLPRHLRGKGNPGHDPASDLKHPPDQASLTPAPMFPACMIRTRAEKKLACNAAEAAGV